MDVEKLFKLSKIKIQKQIIKDVELKISQILQMVDSMSLVNCEDISQDLDDFQNTLLRQDEVHSINTREDLFLNLHGKERISATECNYYRVPKVLED